MNKFYLVDIFAIVIAAVFILAVLSFISSGSVNTPVTEINSFNPNHYWIEIVTAMFLISVFLFVYIHLRFGWGDEKNEINRQNDK